MTKAARISAAIPASTTSSGIAGKEFVSVALFSGFGLLMSLVAIIMGAPAGIWN